MAIGKDALFEKLFHASMGTAMMKIFNFTLIPPEGGITKKSNCGGLNLELGKRDTTLEDQTGADAENIKLYCNPGFKVSDNAKASIIEHMFAPLIRKLDKTGLEVRQDILSKIE